jgi:hypothetical protein
MSKLISTNTLETAEQSLVQKIMIETGIGYLANALLFYAFIGWIRLSHTAWQTQKHGRLLRKRRSASIRNMKMFYCLRKMPTIQTLYVLNILEFQSTVKTSGDLAIQVLSDVRLSATPAKLLKSNMLLIFRDKIKEAVLLFHEPERGVGERTFFLLFSHPVTCEKVLPIAKKALADGQTISGSSMRCYNNNGKFTMGTEDEIVSAFVRLTFN